MNVHEIITEQIIKQLESGVAPWRKPWTTHEPRNLVSKKRYQGLNVFLTATQGFASPWWLTFNQAKQLGGNIRKGQHGTAVVFWKVSDLRRKDRETGELKDGKSFILRYYRVFNSEQCEGIKVPADSVRVISPIEECERIVAEMPNPPAFEQAGKAYYSPGTDTVGLPAIGSFLSAETYHATKFHELIQATGHASRLARFDADSKPQEFGSESYSKEELVAELGAAMLCGVSGISPETLGNSAAYLKSWLDVLKSDSRLILSASSAAQRASDFILGRSVDRGTCSESDADCGCESHLGRSSVDVAAENEDSIWEVA